MHITPNLFMLPIALTCTALSAAVIDFNTLTGNNGDRFLGYSENGFTVSVISGPWSVATLFGNPIPDVFCFLCSVGTLEITGGQFSFESVDFGNPGVAPFSYTITGYLNGSQVLLQSGVNPAAQKAFATIVSAETSRPLDRLDISINTASSDGNVDNIILNPVPEPLTRTLLLLAMGALIGYRAYRLL
jgi:hypothetical protein